MEFEPNTTTLPALDYDTSVEPVDGNDTEKSANVTHVCTGAGETELRIYSILAMSVGTFPFFISSIRFLNYHFTVLCIILQLRK